jgi:adenosylcobinamide-phosphate synthase
MTLADGMDFLYSGSGLLVAAALLDFLLGDPWGWPHPVQAMGWVINHTARWLTSTIMSPACQRIAGVFLGLGLVIGSALASWGLLRIATDLWPPCGWVMEVILLASCFAGRSLRSAAESVLLALKTQPIAVAQQTLSRYVGRDTDELSELEILRAILETVAENSTDGVMAPLFYAILGLALPIGPVPLAMAYKAASTLDSMVGYREAPYTHIGWFSAKLDDVLTWVPCRLNVLTLGLVSGRLQAVWQCCQRDARQDPSPNSGWSECAYAAILEVQLGGLNAYRGVIKVKPLLGKAYRPVTPERIYLALRLMRNSFLLWVLLALVIEALR